ncbi:MAG: CAP domain-containing protein [Actinomycetia bacterium]|nr:CAP domain-containing protein [Actinomycetes bacterium]MCP4224178.1 CAP domain-containing protein [Actinomycetes bacterium]MCP5035944.1 CAP domain-containing protein [Actinomycetes bacterium]
MRSSRANGVLSGLCAVLLLVAAGCGDSDVVASSNLGLDGAVDGEEALQGDGLDPVAVRSTTSISGSRAGVGASDETDPPSPPTLSPAGQDALVTATSVDSTEAPAPTTAAPTTVAPTTTVQDTTTVVSDTSVDDASSSSITTTPGSTSSAPVASQADLEAGEAHSDNLLNQLRTSLGLAVLVRTAEMDTFARDWSRQMAESGDFEHSSGPYGENIAFTSDVTLTPAEAADQFQQLWIGSPGHYDNMVHTSYTRSGIGIYLTEHGWYGTHVFSFG